MMHRFSMLFRRRHLAASLLPIPPATAIALPAPLGTADVHPSPHCHRCCPRRRESHVSYVPPLWSRCISSFPTSPSLFSLAAEADRLRSSTTPPRSVCPYSPLFRSSPLSSSSKAGSVPMWYRTVGDRGMWRWLADGTTFAFRLQNYPSTRIVWCCSHPFF